MQSYTVYNMKRTTIIYFCDTCGDPLAEPEVQRLGDGEFCSRCVKVFRLNEGESA